MICEDCDKIKNCDKCPKCVYFNLIKEEICSECMEQGTECKFEAKEK
jgi:hypothetical protein